MMELSSLTESESSKGLRETFSQLIGTAPTEQKKSLTLKASLLETPLGPMMAIADEDVLYLLEFIDCRSLKREIDRVKQKTKSAIVSGCTSPVISIKEELALYFKGELKAFKTHLSLSGTPFQKQVWEELIKIPFGETRSYAQIAIAIGKPAAFRAVALANSANLFPILIPCHRVIKSTGELCGYNGGIARKKWLIDHEKKTDFSKNT